jgi:hypothetical protein
VSNVVSRQIQKWNFSFEVLMLHWQATLRDHKPFSLARENPEALRKDVCLPDEQAFQYMMKMVALLDQTGPGELISAEVTS